MSAAKKPTKDISKIIIKVGSSGVSHEKIGPVNERIRVLLQDIKWLQEKNYQICLVTSGAINSAKQILNDSFGISELLTLQQARASVGQVLLMKAYSIVAQDLGLTVAQILLTHEDFKDRCRFVNVRNTLNYLMSKNIIPIINENDTVSTKEITVGDNDQLAAMTAECVDANQLILLTESMGLYDRDPKDPSAQLITHVTTQLNLSHIKFGKKTDSGRGGMSTKLAAIKHLTDLGISVVLSSHYGEHPICDAYERKTGTFFEAEKTNHLQMRKKWIVSSVKQDAQVFIDEGAAKALQKNASLLPVGIKKIAGSFKRGDVVSVKFQNKIVAYGISEFSSKELDKIKGHQSDQIIKILGPIYHEVAIHRDNLYLKVVL